jgi:hypothetical protein
VLCFKSRALRMEVPQRHTELSENLPSCQLEIVRHRCIF